MFSQLLGNGKLPLGSIKFRSIICIYFPHQLLPALTALIYHRRVVLKQSLEQPTLIYIRFLTNHDQGNCLAQAIRNSVKDIPWITVKFTFSTQFPLFSAYHIPVKWRGLIARYVFRKSTVQEIFYAHDLSADFMPLVFCSAFPRALRICFGDALGIVYTQAYFNRMRMGGQSQNLDSFFIKLKRKIIANYRRYLVLSNKVTVPNLALLILPVDPGNDFLTKIPYHVPEKKMVLEVLKLLQQPYHEQWTRSILDQEKRFIILATSNLTESKLITLENEIALYQEMVDRHVPEHTILIIKPHPGSNDFNINALRNKLKHRGDILFLTRNEAAYPLELNKEMLLRAEKILSISYSTISIPFLYNIPVEHVLDAQLISKYFHREMQPWVLESNDQYLQIASQLNAWDGNSILSV